MRVDTLHKSLLDAGRRAGFQTHFYGRVGPFELPVLTRSGEPEAPHAYVSAGMHGDEPAGPMALLELLRNKLFPSDLHLTIAPLINPLGLERRTRENPDGIDLNRDYGRTPRAEESRLHQLWLADKRFDLALCLHEDFEATGGYLYELKQEDAPSHARPMLDAMEPFVGIDPAEEIDGMPARKGLMHPPKDGISPDRPDLPEALYLYYNNAPCCYTFETPSAQNIVQRIGAQRAATLAALKILASGGFQPIG